MAIEAISYRLERSEFYSANRWVALRSFKKVWLPVGVIIVVLAVFAALTHTKATTIAALTWLVLVLLFISVASGLRWRKRWNLTDTSDKLLTIEPNDDGIRFEGAYGEGVNKWKAFTLLQESPKFLLLRTVTETFIIIPKRAFEDQRSQNEFKTFVIDKLKTH